MKLEMKRVAPLYLSLIVLTVCKSVCVFGQNYMVDSGSQRSILYENEPWSSIRITIPKGSIVLDCMDPKATCGHTDKSDWNSVRIQFKDPKQKNPVVGWMNINYLKSTPDDVFNKKKSAEPSRKMIAPTSKAVAPVNQDQSITTQVSNTKYCCISPPKIKSASDEIKGRITSSNNFSLDCSKIGDYGHSSLVSFSAISTKVDNYFELTDGTFAAKNIQLVTKQSYPLCKVSLTSQCEDPQKVPAPQRKLAESFGTKDLYDEVVVCKTPYVLKCQSGEAFDQVCKVRTMIGRNGKRWPLPPTRACEAFKNNCWEKVDKEKIDTEQGKQDVCGPEKTKLSAASALCMAATEQYYMGCDKTAQTVKNPDLRKEVFDRIDLAIRDYKKGNGNREGSSLSPTLAECLVTKENHDYQTYRMNSTACGSGASLAVGLFQMTQRLMRQLKRQGFLDETCGDFAHILNNRKDVCGEMDPEVLHDKMSTDRDLQIAIGIEGLDYYLNTNGDNVRHALEGWLSGDGKERFAAEVMSCQSCLNDIRSSDRDYDEKMECCLNKVDGKSCKKRVGGVR